MQPHIRPAKSSTVSGAVLANTPAARPTTPYQRPPARPLDFSAGPMLFLPRLATPVRLQVPAMQKVGQGAGA